MVLARCLEEHRDPEARPGPYVPYFYPAGCPDTAVVCGPPESARLGVIWAKGKEPGENEGGQRVFTFASNVCRLLACHESSIFALRKDALVLR